MSERRFVILDLEKNRYIKFDKMGCSADTGWSAFYPEVKEGEVITESKLKRRLDKILQYALVPNPYDELLDILLHGEGKEGTCVCGKPADHKEACAWRPSQEPDPWEAWVEEMPTWIGHQWQDVQKYEDSMKDWFRKMPRGK